MKCIYIIKYLKSFNNLSRYLPSKVAFSSLNGLPSTTSKNVDY